jgi:hypothetical protein
MREEQNIENSELKNEQSSVKDQQQEKISEPELQTSNLPTGQAGIEPETTNMEVHKHPHHVTHKKRWAEYFLEFLMIFLAVTLGFFAENYRENVSDSHREKGFAQQLYSELKDDSAAVANKLIARLEKEKDMDYLSSFFKDSSLSELPREFYPAYATSTYLINSYAFEPKDGILSQLRNSGSLRYFKSSLLQKLLGDISVSINNVRFRNEQEYQYFASPIKLFILKHFDFSWINQLRKDDPDPDSTILSIINRYRRGNKNIKSTILNLSSFDRDEAANMIMFYKQMLVSTRTLQLKDYIITNHKILEELRHNYKLTNE